MESNAQAFESMWIPPFVLKCHPCHLLCDDVDVAYIHPNMVMQGVMQSLHRSPKVSHDCVSCLANCDIRLRQTCYNRRVYYDQARQNVMMKGRLEYWMDAIASKGIVLNNNLVELVGWNVCTWTNVLLTIISISCCQHGEVFIPVSPSRWLEIKGKFHNVPLTWVPKAVDTNLQSTA